MSRINTAYETYYEVCANGANHIAVFAPNDAKQSEADFAQEFFTAVSHDICFSDCTDLDILRIVFMGQPVEYFGWQQGMKFTYTRGIDGATIWEGTFPHWDH